MAWASSRCEAIENRVKFLMNDDLGQFWSQTQLIMLLNACLKQLAHEGVFKKETTFTSTASTAEYDLIAKITDLAVLYDLHWYDDDYRLIKVSSYAAFLEMQADESDTSGIPHYWFQQANKLYVHPAPSATTANAFHAWHSYYPTEFDVSTNTTPITPKAFDDLYVYYCLYQLHLRDMTRPGHPEAAQQYMAMFDNLLRKLKSQTANKAFGLIPYR